MKASDLVSALPGHPTHPPLTDAVIVGGWLGGTVVFVAGMRVLEEKNRPSAEAARPDAGDGRAVRAPHPRLSRIGETRDGMTRIGEGRNG